MLCQVRRGVPGYQRLGVTPGCTAQQAHLGPGRRAQHGGAGHRSRASPHLGFLSRLAGIRYWFFMEHLRKTCFGPIAVQILMLALDFDVLTNIFKTFLPGGIFMGEVNRRHRKYDDFRIIYR